VTRQLSADETALWERLKRSVKPLAPVPAAAPEAAPKQRETNTSPPPPTAPSPMRLARPRAPSPGRLEEKERRRLRRRLIEVDDRLDLHGMSQQRAFAALAAFLRRAQARGNRIVLVVTGKGRGEGERGVLRDTVPAWLAGPDFRPLVSAVEEAGRRHGGAGALYVRIRRRVRA
jgi:DNA-nicking Smr family endonuclease